MTSPKIRPFCLHAAVKRVQERRPRATFGDGRLRRHQPTPGQVKALSRAAADNGTLRKYE